MPLWSWPTYTSRTMAAYAIVFGIFLGGTIIGNLIANDDE